MEKRMLIIVNPCSGTRQGIKRLGEIINIMQDGGYLCTAMITPGRGAATDFARQSASDYDMVVCVGGDGTFNEVVSGMLASNTSVPLGYIPAGSTNDFASSLHISSDILTAAKDIVSGSTRKLDIGAFGDRSFSYVASFGAFTKTSYSTSQSFKNAFGHLAYILSGAKDVLSIRSQHMRFETDTRVFDDDYIFGAVSNSTSLGGVLTIDPDLVDMSDGMFEMLLIKKPTTLTELLRITNALTRRKYDCDMIDFVSTARVRVSSDAPADWSLDGEKATAEDVVDIVNLHNALHLVAVPAATMPEKVVADCAMPTDLITGKRLRASKFKSLVSYFM